MTDQPSSQLYVDEMWRWTNSTTSTTGVSGEIESASVKNYCLGPDAAHIYPCTTVAKAGYNFSYDAASMQLASTTPLHFSLHSCVTPFWYFLAFLLSVLCYTHTDGALR